MVDFLVRFTDGKSECFMEWSTISDGPNTSPGTEADLRAYIKEQYGQVGMHKLDERIIRCRHRGHSLRGTESNSSLEEALACNRAGKDETRMTVAQMVDYYLHCGGKGEPPIGDWPPVRGNDFSADDDDIEGTIDPDSRDWACPIHGTHRDGPFCKICSAKARERCKAD